MTREMRIAATLENLDAVLLFLNDTLAAYGVSRRAKIQIDVAVEELFVNVAHYAYTPDTGDAVIRAEFDGETVSITLEDWGQPYNPLEKPDPDVTLSAEERPIGGLGIYMVKESMDDVGYVRKDGRNCITIRKRCGETAAGENP